MKSEKSFTCKTKIVDAMDMIFRDLRGQSGKYEARYTRNIESSYLAMRTEIWYLYPEIQTFFYTNVITKFPSHLSVSDELYIIQWHLISYLVKQKKMRGSIYQYVYQCDIYLQGELVTDQVLHEFQVRFRSPEMHAQDRTDRLTTGMSNVCGRVFGYYERPCEYSSKRVSVSLWVVIVTEKPHSIFRYSSANS